MGIRKTINDYPAISASVAGAIWLLLVLLVLLQTGRGSTSNALTIYGSKAFYSDDDGSTWFIDDASQLPPFDHNGKKAYRAILFRCGTGKPFIAYLEKYSDAELKAIAAMRAAQVQRDPSRPPNALPPSAALMDLKKPGDAQWLPAAAAATAAYRQILAPACPDGPPATAVIPADADAH